MKRLGPSGKKAGFTLVEVLVALLCATLVLSMVAGTAIFLTQSSGEIISKAENLYHADLLRDYILSKTELKSAKEFVEKLVLLWDGRILYNGFYEVQDTTVEFIKFSNDAENKLIYCTLFFPNETYRFVVGTEQTGDAE